MTKPTRSKAFRAAKPGPGIADRAAAWRFIAAEPHATLEGIRARAICRCGGPRHNLITAQKGT